MRPVRIIKSKALGFFTQVSGVHDSCKEIGIMGEVLLICTTVHCTCIDIHSITKQLFKF